VIPEVKLEFDRHLKSGVTVIVTNVPTRLTTGANGEEIRGYSMGVALRLEELVKYALEGNPVGSVTLEF
jgi:hypothetical protein